MWQIARSIWVVVVLLGGVWSRAQGDGSFGGVEVDVDVDVDC